MKFQNLSNHELDTIEYRVVWRMKVLYWKAVREKMLMVDFFYRTKALNNVLLRVDELRRYKTLNAQTY